MNEMRETENRHEQLLRSARQMQLRGRSVEEILVSLRDEGASAMESIKAMRELLGISLGAAKDLVHHSHAWSELQGLHEAVHDKAVEAVEDTAELAEREGTYRFRVELK